MMKTICKLIIAACSVLLFPNCSDNTLDSPDTIPEGEAASINLDFGVENAPRLSRAASPTSDEYKVKNLYVLIFNSDKSLATSQFFKYENLTIEDEKTETGTGKTSGKVIMKTLSGTGKTIWAIANIENGNPGNMRDITEAKLDAIETLDALQALTATLKQATTARGTNFLMSGTTETSTVDIPAGENVQLGTKIILKRVDAKITFNIKTGEGVTFTPKEWQVVKASKTVSLLPATSDPVTSPEDYFKTSWQNYEGTEDNNDFGRTFSFYVAENRKTPNMQIPAYEGSKQLTPEERYAYREKQEKINIGTDPDKPGQSAINGKYLYANDNSTYVVMTGNIRYQYALNQEVSADVVYTIHLGYMNQNPDDYNTTRNKHYTYNVTIVNAEQIIIEVDDGIEKQPGAEGEVVIANKILYLDSHYEVKTVNFHYSQIDESLTWYVKTAFSEGMAEAEPKDYEWIKFMLNAKNGSGYNADFKTYPGREKIYADNEIPVDGQISGDKLLNVKQLVQILKENKKRANQGNLTTLFDGGKNITFTAFIDENYYEKDPRTGNGNATLWKRFVNQPERIMNILSLTKYSPDGESIKHVAVTSFRQKSIQTMYNVNAGPGLQTAWGTECEQETGKRPFWNQEHTTAPTYGDPKNGWANTTKLWAGATWDYIDPSKNQMKEVYNYARYNCMQRNRDLNGNGTVDPDEVRWYLAAIDQLTDLWIGENSFDADARLFKGTKWDEDWYVSSTVPGRYDLYGRFGWTVDSRWDNPIVLWSSEGSSVGNMSGVTDYLKDFATSGNPRDHNIGQPFNYRCVRNLGPVPENEVPQDFATYDNTTKTFSLEYLNEKSIRAYTQTNELPEHHERQADNLPWWNFEVNPGANLPQGYAANWIKIRDAINAGNSPCPDGWRVPNQRELALMLSRVKDDGGWTANNHMSRTRFSMNPTGAYRHGFSVSNNAGILFLINNSGETGGVRCVRDLSK